MKHVVFSLHLKCRMEASVLLLIVGNLPFFVEREYTLRNARRRIYTSGVEGNQM